MGILMMLPVFFSCSEHEISYYDGRDAIYFDQQYGANFDTLRLSHQNYSYVPFGVLSIRDSIVRVKVETAGYLRDYDRPFQIEVVADSTNAVEGVDYELPVTNPVIIAGQNSTYIPVIIHRTDHTELETVKLQLRLIPGEHFVCPFGPEGIGTMPKREHGGDVYTELGLNADAAVHNIFSNMKLRKPEGWNPDYFGKFYSEKKYELMLELSEAEFGYTVFDFDKDPDLKMRVVRAPRVAKHVAAYLMEQYNKGRDYWVIDEDGTMMWLLGVSWEEGTRPEDMND